MYSSQNISIIFFEKKNETRKMPRIFHCGKKFSKNVFNMRTYILTVYKSNCVSIYITFLLFV